MGCPTDGARTSRHDGGEHREGAIVDINKQTETDDERRAPIWQASITRMLAAVTFAIAALAGGSVAVRIDSIHRGGEPGERLITV